MAGLDDVKQLHLVDSLESAMELKRWLGERRPVMGFDTESGGLEWWRVRLRMVQFGDSQTGWAVPWGDWAGLVKEVFREYDRPMVAHNLTFDLHMLESNGVFPRRELCHDTAVMAHLIDSTRRKGLKYLASNLVDPRATMGEAILEEAMQRNRWTWDTIPIDYEGYWVYGALDTVITAKLHEILAPQIEPFRGVYDTEMAVGLVLMDMERRGIPVDLDYLHQQHDRLLGYFEQASRWVEESYGFGPGSSAKVASQLIADGALDPTTARRTDSGKGYKVDIEVLEEVVAAAGDHPRGAFAKTILTLRKARHFANAYFGRMIELHDSGIIHPSMDPLGARTSRMSISKPPLQQMPADSPLVRDSFVSPGGELLVPIDYDQIEVRLLAHFAEDPTMISAIRGGEDLHWRAARQVYGPDATKAHRSLVKSGVYGKIYGIGWKKFARAQGVSDEEAKAFLTQYDTSFPSVPRFINHVQDVGRRRHLEEGRAYVQTSSGRRLYLQSQYPDAYYKLVNYLIQGTAAEVLKHQILALDAAGLAQYVRLPVHDELLFSFPEDEANELGREAKRVMEDHTTFKVPLTAEMSSPSKRWGDKYDLCSDGRHSECDRRWCVCETCGRAA